MLLRHGQLINKKKEIIVKDNSFTITLLENNTVSDKSAIVNTVLLLNPQIEGWIDEETMWDTSSVECYIDGVKQESFVTSADLNSYKHIIKYVMPGPPEVISGYGVWGSNFLREIDFSKVDCSKLQCFEVNFMSHGAINKINFTNCALREGTLICGNLGASAYNVGGYETEIILDGFLGISATGNTPVLSIQSTPVTRISTKNVTFISQSTNEWQPFAFGNLPAVETIDLSGMSLIGDNFKLGTNVFTALSNIKQIYMDIDPSRFSITTSNLFVDCPEGTEEIPRTFYYNAYYDYSTIINQLPNGWNAIAYKNEPNVDTFNVETELIINANDVEWNSTSVPITYNYIEKTNINGVDVILNSAEGTDTVSIEQNSETNPVIKTISYTYLGITASVEITQSGKPGFSNYTIAKQDCVAGDILISNQSGEKYFVRGIDNFNTITALEPNVWTPIGICVIPASHNVYGTGECAVISLVSMDHLNPDTGSIKTVPVRMTGRKLNKNNLALFYGTLTSQSETYTNYATSGDNMAAMPSDAFWNETGVTACTIDPDTAYYTGSLNPSGIHTSPYLRDDSRNTHYGEQPGGISTKTKWTFDGKELCAADSSNTLSVSSGPNITCSKRFHTVGTNAGDWYIPALGELGYVMARLKIIRKSLDNLRNLNIWPINNLKTGYNSEVHGTLTGDDDLHLGSCSGNTWSNGHYRIISLSVGMEGIQGYYGHSNAYSCVFHAFYRF